VDIFLLDKVWLFPAIMAASFLVILFVGKRLPEKATALIGIGAVGICFVLSLGVGAQWISRVNNPPTGAEAAAAAQACGVEPDAHGTADPHAAEPDEAGDGHAEDKTKTEGHTTETTPASGGDSHETGAGIGFVPGESAAGAEAPAAGEGDAHAAEGEGEHHSVVGVCKTINWFDIGDRHFEAGTVLDGLSAMMLFTVTLISLLVHVYSMEYLHDDRRFTHYYAFLSLFTASMLFYVLGSNTLQMLVGWELVGLCSFALIGHWWEEKANSDAALKAFLTNRVGDVGLILGVITLFFAAGHTFNVHQINQYALGAGLGSTVIVVGGLLLFGGVTSKSGQFPLHTWLPDAMAGPTPVSALIHAATMVVAGVYLIARMYGVFFSGLNLGSGILIGDNHFNWVAVAGGLTTLVGGTLAFVQHDLKKVLAYSTISQLGYMVLGLGVGAWTGGIFHLFTHAMFKACLFLGAGSVSHACHHTFDMREMGGLRKKMPVTFATFIAGSMALAGIPLMSGFWSKDEILAGASQNGYWLVFGMGIITALMTAAYTTRAVWLTFMGDYRGHAHPHESPKVITIPLVILAVMSFVVMFANIPKGLGVPEDLTLRFEHFVQPTFAFPAVGDGAGLLPEVHVNYYLIGASTLISLIGISLMYLYVAKGAFAGLTAKVAPLRAGYTLLVNKYYLDALYTDVIVGAMKGPIARAMYWINMKVIDAIVVGAGVGARSIGGHTYKYIDQAVVDTIVNGSGMGAEESGQFLRRSQTGKVQQYASLLFGGAVAFAGVLILAIQLSSNV